MKAVKIILPLLLLAAGVFAARRLIEMKPEAKKHQQRLRGVPVEVQRAQLRTHDFRVRGYGSVVAARQLDLQIQVSGEIVELNPKLLSGGRIKAGEPLLRVEKRDYQLAITQAKGQLAQARLNQELEAGRQAVANREWSLLGEKKRQDAVRSRVLREPQQRNAKAALDAAQAGLSKARLNSIRTQLKAPFNALILSESVELGQIIAPGKPLARLVGTDHFWVQMTLPLGELKYLRLGEPVQIHLQMGEQSVKRSGKLLRILGDLEPKSRLARLIVEVEDPLGIHSGESPLFLGAFVELELRHTQVKAVELPRRALKEGGLVWIVDQEKKLRLRSVKELRRMEKSVLLSGIKEGEQVIISRISTPLPGMLLRLPEAAQR